MSVRKLALFFAVLALVAAACSSDDSDDGSTSVAPPTGSVDIDAAAPIQVLNDQGARATIEFAGDALALVEGGAHIVDIQMEIEANSNDPGVSVNLVSTDGEITTTGTTDDGDTFTPTWAWNADGNQAVVTMVGRGVSVPDTRPTVVVSVQETSSSDPVEFVLTAESGSGGGQG